MNRRVLVTLAALALAAPGAARAGSSTGTVSVSASVGNLCVVSNATLAFGAYDPIAANVSTPLDQQTTITLSCTGGTAWTLGLGLGGNASGSQRRMVSGGVYLNYGLFKDSTRTTAWGDAVVSDRQGATQSTTGSTTLTIYGRVPAGQLPSAGSYADSVTATIYF